jgi:hypothetical protein
MQFPHASTEVIWIVSVLEGHGTHLSFPVKINEPGISFSLVDENQTALDLFDRFGFRVWLQVEPGDANIVTVIGIILTRYAYHPRVIGIGVDVEWHHSSDKPEWERVYDDEAASWLAAARVHGKQYRLFLKHWEVTRLPSTLRDGLLFIDDSQMFDSLEAMLAEFVDRGQHFYTAPVAFQIGYPAEKTWGRR